MAETKKKDGISNPITNHFLQSKDKFKTEIVTLKGEDGKDLKVMIKEPNGRQRGLIFKSATKIKKNQEPEIDHAELQVWAVIFCSIDPETREPIFDEAHHDALLDLPSSVFDTLAKPALQMLGDAPEEAMGNS